jgi:ribosomal protein S6--L-glutamate ligase
MLIWSLTRNFELHSSRRLAEAARARGHELRELDTTRLTALAVEGGLGLLLDGEPLEPADFAVFRSGYRRLSFGWDLALWRHVEAMGVPTLNSTRAVLRCSDKFYTHQLLRAAGIPTVDSALVTDESQLKPAAEAVGGFPLVLKWVRGTRGVGTALVESLEALRGQWQLSAVLEQNALLERYHPESGGRDLRLLVLGGRVLACYERRAPADDFRSNLHRGGRGAPHEPADQERELALAAAKVLELEFAGVDLLPTSGGPKVLEINSVPGFRGVEEITGVDVAGAVIARIEELAGRGGP